jgi:putative transposase
MSDLFKNKYRISSARLQSWNYANPGMYFVTICTKNKARYFGDIVDTGCTQYHLLSEIGQIAYSEWLKTPEIRPDMNLQLGEFVIMPDHMHGVLIIGDNEFNGNGGDGDRDCRDAMHRISTAAVTTAPTDCGSFAPQSKNLASIIRGYKSAVTTYARKNNILFDWQTRFHDHIIRSMDEYYRISDYIQCNSEKWLANKKCR